MSDGDDSWKGAIDRLMAGEEPRGPMRQPDDGSSSDTASEDDKDVVPGLVSDDDSDGENTYIVTPAAAPPSTTAEFEDDVDTPQEDAEDHGSTVTMDEAYKAHEFSQKAAGMSAEEFAQLLFKSWTDGGGAGDADGDHIATQITRGIMDMSVRPPNLDDAPIHLYVQFYTEEEGEPSVFVCEACAYGYEIPRHVVIDYCDTSTMKDRPLRIRLKVIEDGIDDVDDDEDLDDEDDDEDLDAIDTSEDEEAAADAAATAAAVPERPKHWIPSKGRINVLAGIGRQNPILIGILTEHYDIEGAAAATPEIQHPPQTGKRVHWMTQSNRAQKRARDTDAADAPPPESGSDSDPDIERFSTEEDTSVEGMSGFAAPGNQEWTSTYNRSALVCAFEREGDTECLDHVRIALSLHRLSLRHGLQTILRRASTKMPDPTVPVPEEQATQGGKDEA